MPKTDISVRELVDKVQRGELALPEMQRRYVWPATRVRDLLDSLYRGYPSGTILVWETDEEKSRKMPIEATKIPTTSQKLLLLDGQQRITSLAAVLSGEPIRVRGKNHTKTIDILFNLEHPEGPPADIVEIEDDEFTADIKDVEDEEDAEMDIQEELKKFTFVVAGGRMFQNDPVWVPVSDIFKKTDVQIIRPICANLDDPRWDKYSERLKKVRDIAKYMYVMQVLEKDKSYEEVTQIFIRVNSLGMKLRGSDLAFAQITSKWPGFLKLIEDFTKEFGDDDDYIIQTGLPVRFLVVLATKQSKFKTVGTLSKNKLSKSWEAAKGGLQYAINFLRSNAEIEDLRHLSSPFLLIPIAVYFILKGDKLSQQEEKDLLKWFYLAHMRGHYSMGSSESILNADLSILYKTKSISALIDQLHLHVKKFEVDENDLINKGIRSPFFSMLYFVLRQNGAKDWYTGLKISSKHTGKAHKIQDHHIFPRALLREEEKYDTKEINEIANMAFIGGKTNRQILKNEPIVYLENIVTEKGKKALTSHLITTDRKLWEIKQYREFLSDRRKAIVSAINEFMKKFE